VGSRLNTDSVRPYKVADVVWRGNRAEDKLSEINSGAYPLQWLQHHACSYEFAGKKDTISNQVLGPPPNHCGFSTARR
jgi:hypothetical protein